VPETVRWSAEQVLALAPDAPSARAGRALASPSPWRETGYSADPPVLWGLCKGSGREPYQTCVDLAEPAYRCSCPSRKFPCKHGLALMLLWSAGRVSPGEAPAWVTDWLASRTERKAKVATRKPTVADPRTAQRRAERVAAGVEELDRWLADQVRQGIASQTGYEHWDAMAARLVDAQAPGLASAVRRLANSAGAPDRLLTELSLIRLLVTGYRRGADVPADLAATIRTRVGFPVASEDVLARERVRDDWAVVAVRDEGDERLTVRRCWLRGSRTGRPALVLSFAPPGLPLPADLPLGTAVDADLCYYPGVLPMRALVAARRAAPVPYQRPPAAGTVAQALDAYGRAIAAEPWLERWPVLLAEVVPVRERADRWFVRDEAGDALPVDPAATPPWRLVAAAGGAPAAVAAELTAAGVRPLTVWTGGRLVLA
jgi:hypothetical protein